MNQPLTPGEFEASLDAVTAALEARAQVVTPRRRLRAVVMLAAAAAVLLGLFAWRREPPARRDVAVVETSGGVSDVTSSRERDFASGSNLEAGQRMKTGEGGSLTLRFAEGTIVTVGARSEFGIHGLGRHRNFELAQGHFEAQVAKLQADETFVVETRRARVEVRGTQFSVEVQRASSSCPEGSLAVKVREGVVAVTVDDAVTEVKAGEQKVLPCVRPVQDTPPPVPTPSPKRAPDEVSPLSRMNAMYGAAMELKQNGRLEEAARSFHELRRAFPKGSLDEAAAVEELRLLERLENERAVDAAREYLKDYPDGYGRDVAERLLTP